MAWPRTITFGAAARAIADVIVFTGMGVVTLAIVGMFGVLSICFVALCLGIQAALLEWAVDHPIGLAYYWATLSIIVTAGHIVIAAAFLASARRLCEEEGTALPPDTLSRCESGVAKNIAVTLSALLVLWAAISQLDPPMLTTENAESRSFIISLAAAVLIGLLGGTPIISVWNERTLIRPA